MFCSHSKQFCAYSAPGEQLFLSQCRLFCLTWPAFLAQVPSLDSFLGVTNHLRQVQALPWIFQSLNNFRVFMQTYFPVPFQGATSWHLQTYELLNLWNRSQEHGTLTSLCQWPLLPAEIIQSLSRHHMDLDKFRIPCSGPVSTAVLASTPERILSLHAHPSAFGFLVTKPQ